MSDPPDATLQPSAGLDDATRVLSPPRAAAGDAGSFGEAASKAPTNVLAPGARVAEFEITRLIGQGGFGIVYEARDHALERVVALKEYLPASLATRAPDGSIVPLSESQRETFDLGMRSFINEARLLARFDHPSLLKVYRFWQERGTSFMVMPLYRGRTLRQALAACGPGGVDEGWLRGIVDGVAQALAVMHEARCYHRDVAPDNILLLEDGDRPVLLDFGAARRVISDKTQAITVILKPGYAPVEQYAEMPDMTQGAWTDVYALAAVMHLAVTGRVPPPSVGRLLVDSYEPLSASASLAGRYSPTLLAAIDAGLAVRPQARPQSMEALRALLGLEGAPAVAGVPAKPGTAQRSFDDGAPRAPVASRGRRAALVGIGVSAAIAIGGGAWWWRARSPAPMPAPVPAPLSDARTVSKPTLPSAPGASPTTVASPQPSASLAPEASSAPGASPAPATSPPSAPAPLPARTTAESLRALALEAAPDFKVSARPGKAQVVIGKDRLDFDVGSSRAGFVYVFLLDSRGELYMLFPNALDKRNRIEAGQTLALPRAAWAMQAGGPPGVNRFAVLVSALERDFTESGVLAGGVFAQFPAPVLAAMESARVEPATPLLGRAICPDGATGCADVYGVAHFEIVEK